MDPIQTVICSILENYVGKKNQDFDSAHTSKCFKETLDRLLGGYKVDVEQIFAKTNNNEQYKGIVIFKDIDLFSICEHHLLPFEGTVDIAYVPNLKIAGIGDFISLINAFSQRLQLQERLTTQIGGSVDEYLFPNGTAVRIKAKHSCTRVCAGQNLDVITMYFSGVFNENIALKNEFLSQI